jgi:UDP-N-acetylglucosamine--N-acetylmuramyl-(pentapeptide) pyrophosphoryl-undecaprenol N-acetylglucosamine transferase
MVRHRIVLTGGGTGGHIYPALAVAEYLKEDPEVEALLYMGAAGHLEEKLAGEQGLPFRGLKVSGMPRKLSTKFLSWPVELTGAILEARELLRAFRPTAVLGTGGYASAPPLAAANFLSVATAVHEPDAHPGLVNRLFASRADLVSLGMEAAADILKPAKGKLIVNGNPVRKSIISPLGRDAACAVLGLDEHIKTILVTGGSQGAQAINQALMEVLPVLLNADQPVQIIHQVGEKNLQAVREGLDKSILNHPRYFLRAYFDDLSIAYAVSDLAVCRAGAMTVAELAVTGTPALFIPYPFAAGDHQTHNARFVSSKGAASLILQSKLSGRLLADELLQLAGNPQRLKEMRAAMLSLGKPQAAADLANQVKEISAASVVRNRALVM